MTMIILLQPTGEFTAPEPLDPDAPPEFDLEGNEITPEEPQPQPIYADQFAHVDSASSTAATVNTYASFNAFLNAQAPISTLEITGVGITYESASVAALAELGDDWVLKAYENKQIVDAPDDLPPPPAAVPQWLQFSTTVMGSTEINVMLGATFQAAPALYGGLLAGLLEAKGGDSRLFLGSWANAQAIGLIPAELIAWMQAAADEHALPAEFVAGLDPN